SNALFRPIGQATAWQRVPQLPIGEPQLACRASLSMPPISRTTIDIYRCSHMATVDKEATGLADGVFGGGVPRNRFDRNCGLREQLLYQRQQLQPQFRLGDKPIRLYRFGGSAVFRVVVQRQDDDARPVGLG